MFFIILGIVCAFIGGLAVIYFVISAAVRDGIDSSHLINWKIAYTEAWIKYPEKLPKLQTIYDQMSTKKAVQNTDPRKRQTLVERLVQMEVRKLLDTIHRERLTTGILIAAFVTIIAGLLIGIGIATL